MLASELTLNWGLVGRSSRVYNLGSRSSTLFPGFSLKTDFWNFSLVSLGFDLERVVGLSTRLLVRFEMPILGGGLHKAFSMLTYHY